VTPTPKHKTAADPLTESLKPVLDPDLEQVLKREHASQARQRAAAQAQKVRMVRRQPPDQKDKTLRAAVARYHAAQ
jgi:hypothetical protein